MTIETKFNVGDEVIFLCSSQIRIGHIAGINIIVDASEKRVSYSICGTNKDEDSLFRSTDELFGEIRKQLYEAQRK